MYWHQATHRLRVGDPCFRERFVGASEQELWVEDDVRFTAPTHTIPCEAALHSGGNKNEAERRSIYADSSVSADINTSRWKCWALNKHFRGGNERVFAPAAAAPAVCRKDASPLLCFSAVMTVQPLFSHVKVCVSVHVRVCLCTCVFVQAARIDASPENSNSSQLSRFGRGPAVIGFSTASLHHIKNLILASATHLLSTSSSPCITHFFLINFGLFVFLPTSSSWS